MVGARICIGDSARWLCFSIYFGILLVGRDAGAQVVGKGWALDSAGSVTSTPAEVISGKNSIKGSYSGSNSFTTVLLTDATFIPFTPNQTYTITLSYRIITAGSRGFSFGVFSSVGSSQGNYVATGSITGAAGASGTATLTATLGPYADYGMAFKIDGTGTIVIDDIRITSAATGQLVASENAEGPTLVPGPLNFQITSAMSVLSEANAAVRSVGAKDLDGDEYPESIVTFTAPRPSTTPLLPLIVEGSSGIRLATTSVFPTGAPTVKHSPVTRFIDINNDGLQDILFAEAGSDAPPFQGSGIGVGLNEGGGKFRNVSSLVPADLQTTRSYALTAGDIDRDGRVEILLPDQVVGTNTALLRWNGTGFDAERNWIDQTLWTYPTELAVHNWLELHDFDRDGKLDLLVAGLPASPGFRMLFGSGGRFKTADLVELGDGVFGQWPNLPQTTPVAQGSEMGPLVIADFNNDGLLDVFALQEQVVSYLPGAITDTNWPNYADCRANGCFISADAAFQMLINQGARKFLDVTSGSSAQNLGRRYYPSAIAVDMNNDGFLDVVGWYQTAFYAGGGTQWGTTVFLNDGTGAFQVVDGTQLLAAVTTTPARAGQQWNLGMFVPTVVNPQRTEGIAIEPVGGCVGGPGFCGVPGLNIYKVVADSAIGTGPNFVDSAALGVPGFNEFYYLRRYADAAASVKAGEYRNGLEHYLAVGARMGYRPHAGACASCGTSASGLTGVIDFTSRPVDLNGDGRGDLFSYNSTSGAWRWDLENGALKPLDGTIRTLAASTTGSWDGGWTVKAADFNGDGRSDLFLYNSTTGRWFKAINNGANNFSYYTEVTSAGYHAAIGNFGPLGAVLDDVFFYNPISGSWSKCISAGDGTVGFNCDSGSWDPGWQVHPVDTTNDNITDLLLYNPVSGVRLIAAPAPSGFAYTNSGAWSSSWQVTPGLFDGMAGNDFLLYNSSNGQWMMIGGVGLNTVGSGTWSANWTVKSGDLNGDGRADIFLYNAATGEWVECFNTGTGEFTYAGGRWDPNWQISITSFNGDARADLLLYNSSGGTYVQCINTGSGTFTYYTGSIGPGMTVVAARPFP